MSTRCRPCGFLDVNRQIGAVCYAGGSELICLRCIAWAQGILFVRGGR